MIGHGLQRHGPKGPLACCSAGLNWAHPRPSAKLFGCSTGAVHKMQLTCLQADPLCFLLWGGRKEGSALYYRTLSRWGGLGWAGSQDTWVLFLALPLKLLYGFGCITSAVGAFVSLPSFKLGCGLTVSLQACMNGAGYGGASFHQGQWVSIVPSWGCNIWAVGVSALSSSHPAFTGL